MFYAPAFRSSRLGSARQGLNGSAGRGLDSFFDEAFDALRAAPACAVKFDQDEKAYTLSADLPGLAKEHLNIEIEGAVVRIRSKDDAPRSFKAAYELPMEIDAAASQAKLENGVLTLTLAKLVPVSKAAQLAIA
jgi:HSP20 family protein